MKIICPACEIWLVNLTISDGEGSFWCLRCSSAEGSLDLKEGADPVLSLMSECSGSLEE